MLPETTKQRIERDAKEWEKSYYTHLTQHSHKGPSFHFIAGATAEAELNQKEIETLKTWKESASAELKKIHDWGQGNKTIPLGKSITDEAVKRLKAYDELREKAQRLADALLSAKAYLTGLSAGGGHMFTSIPPIITEITNALQQWRGEK